MPTITNSSASSSTSLRSGLVIITLLIIVSAVIFLILRHFRRLSYFLSRRIRIRPSSAPATTSSPGDADATTKSLIDSLPFFTFSSVTRPSDAGTSSSSIIEADCAICLSRFAPRDTLRLLPLCCHAFHSPCIDTWFSSGHKTCPLCRSDVFSSSAAVARNGSFRLEIGSISQRRSESTSNSRRSYSIRSFDYVVDAEAEVAVTADKEDGVNDNRDVVDLNSNTSNTITDVSGEASRGWLGEYTSKLLVTQSSRTSSFRSSRRFFTDSSRRSEGYGVGEWDIEASRFGEEISELFRWAAGV